MSDTIADFWRYLQTAFGSALPWVILLVGLISATVLFRGRIAGKWIFPIVVAAAAFWVIRRMFWYYF